MSRISNRQKDKILGNAMEALIGAIFLDAGFKIARELILKVWRRQIDVVRNIEVHAKTALQEYLQSRGEEPPKYKQISRTGPDHDPDFFVEVFFLCLRSS